MVKKNQIKFSVFLKTIKRYIDENFPKFNIINKPGSGIRFEIFNKEEDSVPSEMFVVHRDKFVHKGDLKKTSEKLGIKLEDLIDLINNN